MQTEKSRFLKTSLTLVIDEEEAEDKEENADQLSEDMKKELDSINNDIDMKNGSEMNDRKETSSDDDQEEYEAQIQRMKQQKKNKENSGKKEDKSNTPPLKQGNGLTFIDPSKIIKQ